MDAKDVVTHVKNLEKNKSDEQTVLRILRILDKELVATEKLLRETKVGVIVNQFKKSSNDEIAKLVKKMIGTWKDAITKEKKKKAAVAAGGSGSGAGTAGGGAHSSHSGNSGPHEPKIQEKYHAKGPRSAKNDGVNTTIYGDKLRDMVIRAFYDALAKESEHPPQSILAIAIDIEKHMWQLNDPGENEKAYKDKYRVIYSNVISKNNRDLKHKITNGDITPEYLVNCDPKELAPEHLRKKLEEIAKQNLFNAQGATLERSVTDRFQCGKCKEKKVSYYQLQTRSADEPLTTFCTCEVCGNRWKFS
ncbi:AGR011Wp [Eremothecium gossypii ATCC 10895]|uniref:Transcription elongation factor n=1 Tax=Eremothecium gossypii (strain ATCC 10895 / CBS 109.51 / FGSC 9923 / NRRL Y-1056) TaxID=284811 RepID=Q750E4_EREGS|nr:AGR011Wp [Eremothecium gossypii ATCC 10895]AAS54500.2 AGR011Wp [Eremothecium gossypii ATCC 10895]AEY98832.1 FAGR011Wp [Eremothecium gossypii FDAG1]